MFRTLALTLALTLGPLAVADDAAHPTLALGSAAPAFSLPGIDGKTHTLADYAQAKVLVLVFTCNHCPTAQLYETRIKKLVEDYKGKGVAIVAIEPNDPEAVRLDELGWTDLNDGFEEMKLRAAYRHFNFPYLFDGATQTVANAYGPKATPHVFIFDAERKLRFEGRIDDSQREALVKVRDTRNAIDALLAGKSVAVAHTPVFGCSTKWKSKSASQAELLHKMEAEPVTLAPVSVEGLQKLRANGTDKYVLINFWATWCGPCTAEFDDLLTTWRMYRHRDFDLVFVSTNMPDEQAGVEKFLKKHHASTRNLIFGSTDTYALQAAFNKKWESGVPYSVLLAPDGKVVYEREGALDILELRRAILGTLPDDDYLGHRNYWSKKD